MRISKASCPYTKKCVNAEKVCYLTHLGQVKKDHMQSDGEDLALIATSS